MDLKEKEKKSNIKEKKKKEYIYYI